MWADRIDEDVPPRLGVSIRIDQIERDQISNQLRMRLGLDAANVDVGPV